MIVFKQILEILVLAVVLIFFAIDFKSNYAIISLITLFSLATLRLIRSKSTLEGIETFLDDGRMQIAIHFLMLALAIVLYITFRENLSSSYLFGFGFVSLQAIREGHQKYKVSRNQNNS